MTPLRAELGSSDPGVNFSGPGVPFRKLARDCGPFGRNRPNYGTTPAGCAVQLRINSGRSNLDASPSVTLLSRIFRGTSVPFLETLTVGFLANCCLHFRG